MMSNLLGGLQGTAYLGTNANQPPNCNFNKRDPVSTDVNYSLNDFWLNTVNEDVWVLVSLQGGPLTAGQVATWVKLTQGSTGNVEQFTTDDANIVLPLLGNVFMSGGLNINTVGFVANTVHINLDTSILQPPTNASGLAGIYALGTSGNYNTDRFLHNYGVENTFVGYQSGNLSLTVGNAQANTGIGYQSLTALTTGPVNTALGFEAGATVTSGGGNLLLGAFSGANLLGTENNNIYLSNIGANESNTIRIGTDPTHTAAYMAGVYGQPVNPASKLVVVMDNTGKLGTSAGGAGGGIETVEGNDGIKVPGDVTDNVKIKGDGTSITVTGDIPTNTLTISQIGGTGNPFAFSYYQNGDVGPTNATVTLGASAVLTKIFDDGNNVFPGDGIGGAAYFAAPVTGRYYLEFYAVNGNTGAADSNTTVQVITPERTYTSTQPSSLGGVQGSTGYTVVTDLIAGEHVTYTVTNSVINHVIAGNTTPALNNFSTRISGFLLPTSSTGGSFTQPFYYLQTADSVNVTGDGTTFVIGSDGNLTMQYDIGSNVVNGVFTAPVTGVYSFKGQIVFDQGAGGNIILRYMQLTTTTRSYVIAPNASLGNVLSVDTFMNAGDTAFMSITNNYNPPGTKTHSVLASTTPQFGIPTTSVTYFQGFRIA